MLTRQNCLDLDAADPLAIWRQRFRLPTEVVYLDGNSLGALPAALPVRLHEVMEAQWGCDLIASWNSHGWIDLPLRVGAKIARLMGAAPDEVVAADSVSVNLFKLVAAALRANSDRKVVLTEAEEFPTDLYILQGIADLLPGVEVRIADPGGLEKAMNADVAVMLLSHVHYRTGRMRDMAGLNANAHRLGIYNLWDLSHSVGALDVDLTRDGADLAAGCGYKYLNGGPGAPAYLFVARTLQAQMNNPISGWMGHARPFEFASAYQPAEGIARWLSGTPNILSLAALDVALDVFEGASMAQLQLKSRQLGDLFVALVEQHCGTHDLRLISPHRSKLRGAQVAFAHPNAYAIVRALIDRGVIGDFRVPDAMRFGFSPLYLRFADMWDAVHHLANVLDGEVWRDERYRETARVT